MMNYANACTIVEEWRFQRRVSDRRWILALAPVLGAISK